MSDPKWLREWNCQQEKSKKNWLNYSIRNEALKAIGFETYNEYLASPLWQTIRSKRLSMGDTCSCCADRANVVHHDTYYKKLLLGDEKSIRRDLYPLCHSCHFKVEFDGQRKRSSGEAIKVFRRMLYKFEHGQSKGQMIRAKMAKKKAERKSNGTA